MEWIWIVIIGGIAGWWSGVVMTGRGFGLVGNIIVGVIGAVLGRLVFETLGTTFVFFLEAVTGAMVLALVAGLVRRPSSNT